MGKMKWLEEAKKRLVEEKLTCVMISDKQVYISKERGVKPLLACLRENKMPRGFAAADKVIGKAAAFLYVLLGAAEIYAGVISRHALRVLQEAGIAVQYDVLTDAIVNRTGTGFCPMETAVMEIHSPQEALLAIEETLKKMNKG